MRKYRVSKELKKYLRRVLVLSRATWHMETDENGQCWCYTTLSSNHFHRLVQRAKCEKITEETGVLHVTFKESRDIAFVTYLMHERNAGHYCVIGDEEHKKESRN